jgi:hypothetical protein
LGTRVAIDPAPDQHLIDVRQRVERLPDDLLALREQARIVIMLIRLPPRDRLTVVQVPDDPG